MVSDQNLLYDNFTSTFNLEGAVDRTGIFHDSTAYPIPEFRQLNDTFSEIVDKRVLEYGDDTILFWDGSIQGTLIISAFIKHNKPLAVFCNAYSACGYPKLFIDIINTKYSNINLVYNFNFNLTGFVGTTSHGIDQLLGINSLYIDKGYQTPYKEVFTLEEQELFKLISQKCPYEIITLQDARWWIGFTQGWDESLSRSRKIGGGTLKYTKDFFNCDNFQLWSMSNQGKIYRTSITSNYNHRLAEKEYIYSVIKDDEYLTHNNVEISGTAKDTLGQMINWGIQKVKQNLPEFTSTIQSIYNKN